jgi:hypothetical protein
MERWQFIESPNGAWYWLASDVLTHRTRTSAATFTTRYECIADAASSGYQTNAPGGSQAPAKPASRHRRHSGQRRERYA